MRGNRLSGSEGGATFRIVVPTLSIIWSLRDCLFWRAFVGAILYK